jgi:hypothetical protein
MTDTALRRVAVENALAEFHRVAIKAELHPAYAQLAVDMGRVLQFEAPDWEILSGRPGTGKTFVLKAWEEQALAAVGRPTILPLYISARDMLDPPGEEDDPDQRAVAHFQLFLEKFGDRLKETTAAARAKESTVERLLGGVGARIAHRQIEAKLREINRAVQTGRPLPTYHQLIYERQLTRDQSRRARIRGRIRGGLGTGLESILSVGGEADQTNEESSHARENVGGKGRMAPRYSEIRGHVEDLTEILGIERFCVLLDQWSLIDRKVQPAVAELLVRALGGAPAITFKIAANPSQVNLFDDERQHGFRVDHDLIEAVGLDEPRMSEEALVDFYEDMVFNRLCYLGVDPELFLEDRSGRPSADFIETLFQSREAFEILVKGSEGVSHSFLLTFRRLAESGLPVDGWSVAEAREAVGLPEAPVPKAVRFSDVFQNVTDAEITIEYVIRPVVVATESRLFLVRREDRDIAKAPLEELTLLGLIEPARHDVLPRGLEHYVPYWLSEERYRAFGRAILFKQDVTVRDPESAEDLDPRKPRIETEKDALRYVVDFSRFRV